MSRAFLQGHQSLAQEQRLQPPYGSLSRADESGASGSHKDRRGPWWSGPRPEAGQRPDVAGTASLQDPWRTHLAIHRLRQSGGWKMPPLPKAGPPSSDPVPTEDADGQEPQKEASRARGAPAPGSAPTVRGASHYPFPKRKAPRISEAAQRLGLYRPT